ncbi:hypothetical protein PFISCL1PPCAC_21791, partial [Pristionchus fissidentatus]
ESKPQLNGQKKVKREDVEESDIEILDSPPIKKELVDGGNGGMVPIRNARSDMVLIRVSIVNGNMRETILIEVPSTTRVCSLGLHPDLKIYIKDNKNEWRYNGDVLGSLPISALSSLTKKRPIDLICTVQKEEGDKMRGGEGESNGRIKTKEKRRGSALALIDNSSNAPRNLNSIDNSTPIQSHSIPDNQEMMDDFATDDVKNEDETESIPEENEHDGEKDDSVPLVDTTRKTRVGASKVIDYTESSGEEEEREKEKSDDEDEEKEKGEEEDNEPPAKKKRTQKKEEKREMECPKCTKYRSTSVPGMIWHLKVVHRTTASEIGIKFLCACGYKSACSEHNTVRRRSSQKRLSPFIATKNVCKLLNFKIIHDAKSEGVKCIMC